MKNLQESMKIELTEKEPCLKKADIVIPADSVERELDIAVKEFVQHAQLPGFRAGKAPKALIKKRFKSNIDEELMRRFQVAAFEK
jgi:trigger factor